MSAKLCNISRLRDGLEPPQSHAKTLDDYSICTGHWSLQKRR
jgi:hypothetical protein